MPSALGRFARIGLVIPDVQLHPMDLEYGYYFDLLGRTIKRFLSPERGARTQVYLASAPEVAAVTGRYFVRCRETSPSEAARDERAQRRLWDVSRALTGTG